MISQNMILNKILDTKDMSIITLNNLTEKHFFNYKAEFLFIKNHYEQYGKVPDKIVFANTFRDFQFVEVTESDLFLVQQLLRDYNGAYLSEKFNEMKRLLESDKIDEAVSFAQTALENLRVGSALQCTDITKDTSRYDRYIDRCTNEGKYYISSGFPELDKLIGGIDRENENMVIIARTGQGKTWLMLKLAAAMSLQGLNVGIYSGEMTTDKVAYRLDTLMAHMKNRSISRSDKFYNDVYYKYISNLPKRNIGSIKVITPTDIADEPTVDVLKTFIEKEHLDVLCVDQYSLLEDARGGKTERDQIANISKAIKKLQVAKKIPIISVSQQNRTKNDDGKKKEVAIDTTQVYGSDRIPQDCTILLGIERDEDENESPLFKINIVKARDGGEGKVLTYRVDLNEGYFDYIPNVKDGISSKADLDALKGEFSLDLDKDAPAPTPANNPEVFA